MRLEIWRSIDSAPYFAVSNHGRVQYLLTGELMEEHVDDDGDDAYLGVNLLGETGDEFCAPIEVLVVEAFLGPIDGLERIIHRDGDPGNNNDWNLDVDDAYSLHRMACDDCE